MSRFISIFLFLTILSPSLQEDPGYDDAFFRPTYDCEIPAHPRDPNATRPLFKKQPLRQRDSFDLQFAYPNAQQSNSSKPSLKSSSVQLVCGSEGNSLARNSEPLEFLSSAIVRCHRHKNGSLTWRLFNLSNHYLFDFKSFSEISCVKRQMPESHVPAVPLSYGPCRRANVTCLEIGFSVPPYISILKNLRVIKYVAVDEKKLQPQVAFAWMPPTLAYSQVDQGNYSMKRGVVFAESSVDIEEVYRRDHQVKRLLEILGDQKLVDDYIPESGDGHLVAGMLISDKDLFYKVQKPSAYFYENTVPIWKDVAMGNWDLAGRFLRDLAAKNRIGFLYYSGAIGTLELSDKDGNEKKIFLAQGRDDEPVVPVPKLLFKYVVGRTLRDERLRSLVLVTVNDPRVGLSDLAKRGYLVPNCKRKMSCQLSHPEFLDPSRGYTYCCDGRGFLDYAKELDLPYKSASDSIV